MPEHVSVYQLLGMTLLVLVAVAWALGLAYMLRRGRHEAALWRVAHGLPALPHQRQAAPGHESVELTAAEEHAFAGLVRQLGSGR
ncbi:hypothetical protein [Streptomyces sp. SID13726]|uniref:hypothetical protein n=1 Tax=Streptomyces sp. SID13726 TaxID=2706058 RepID=UPI0013B9DCD9|nr:hypothetical protein [Streptomyces sp. SID13726]NEB05107.1 hypothetical protein [Streptomyces sp. SID13726]